MPPPLRPDQLKSCCVAFYEQPLLRALFGDSLHPGGVRTTTDLGRRLALATGDSVLDIACGPGRSAVRLIDTFGCRVTGLDYSVPSIAEASAATGAAPGGGAARFVVGDGERLPFRDYAFDAVVIECSLCLFPDKGAALREMRRVLKPNGRIGIADLAVERPLPPLPDEILAWVACVAGACSTSEYGLLLHEAGFVEVECEDASWALTALAEDVGRTLFLWDVAAGLGKLPALPVTPAEARAWLREAHDLIAGESVRYVLLTGRRP